MFIQGIPFLHTTSTGIQFKTIKAFPNKNRANKIDILCGIDKVCKLYAARGLKVKQLNGDNEFSCIKEDIQPIFWNIVAAKEYISNVERSIRTLKEETRCLIHNLPYRKYPKVMIIGCVNHVIKTDNNIISQSGLSLELPPTTIVTGVPPPNYEAIMTQKFGDYAQVFKDTTNTSRSRTQVAIALYPSGNLQNGWIFMSLTMGREIHRKQWTHMAVNQKTIDQVEDLATKDGQHLIADNFDFGTKAKRPSRMAQHENEAELHVVQPNVQPIVQPMRRDEGITRVHDVIDTPIGDEQRGEPLVESEQEIEGPMIENEDPSSINTDDESWKRQIGLLKDQFLTDIDQL